ncbi:hypothetical protein LguiB_034842 [Lonicera macranthoides]
MENNNNQSSFWQFSDQLRVQTNTNNLSNLSLNDSIWSTSYPSKRPENRRNFDIRVGGEVLNPVNTTTTTTFKSDFNNNNFNNDVWKIGSISPAGVGLNGGFNKGIYSKPSMGFNNNNNNNINSAVINTKSNRVIGNGKGEDDFHFGGKNGKKNKNNNNSNNLNQNKDNSNGDKNNSVDKRFKTLPPAESLPRNETVGGYIFVCNNDTMQENLKRQLFGLPPRYRDSVRQITPGLPLFLYNYSTHQLHGVFEAASFGGTNIDPTAWEDKKNPGESRFPAQVRVMTRKVCEPLEEDSFRPILHHYDGPKFRLELNIPEAISLLDIFEESDP